MKLKNILLYLLGFSLLFWPLFKDAETLSCELVPDGTNCSTTIFRTWERINFLSILAGSFIFAFLLLSKVKRKNIRIIATITVWAAIFISEYIVYFILMERRHPWQF